MTLSPKPLKIYNASAGSGKTYTLVQEYLKIVLHHKDPIKFRSILAMTFTNKAANEMKGRIIETLIDLGTENHFKTKQQLEILKSTSQNSGISEKIIEFRAKEILNKILHNYSSFSVMTIDKFTHKVIRTFAKDLGISIDFNVEMDITGFRKSVTDMLFDQIGRNKKLSALMLNYAKDNLQQDKSWNFAKDLFNFTSLLFKEDAISAVDNLKELTDEDFNSIRADLVKQNAMIENLLLGNINEVLDLISSKGLNNDDFVGKGSGVLAYFKRIDKGDYKLPSKTLIKNAEAGKWSHPKSPNATIVDGISDLIHQYFNQIYDLIERKIPQLKLNQSILNNLNNLSLLKYLLELIEKIKSDENVLLLSDFYKEIADIVAKEPVPFIYERLGVRYQHFLLDEFQDTSQLQWINLIPLVHNSLAQNHENLIVGDGKQAIYRWRNGEVEQFTKLPNEIHNPNNIASLNEATTLFKSMGEKISLGHNYRSAQEIVNFNNAFFKTLSQNLDPDLKYIFDQHEQIATKKFSGYVEGYFNPTLEKEDQLEFVLESVRKARHAGFTQKDICIITRRNITGAEIATHLTQYGYKIISPESLFIGKDRTVKFLFYLMTSISNRNDKNSIVKTIEHYCTLNDLQASTYIIDHENEYRKLPIRDFFKAKSIEIEPPELFHNLYDFVEHLIEVFDFDPGENPHLQFFLENIHQFETSKSSNIRDFLAWFKEKGKDKSIISPEGADAINIMTIHKSKGLQFPVVICPFFDWNLELHKQISWIERPNEQLPAYFVKMSQDLENSILRDTFKTEKNKYDLDQFNLLYVAFTRPEVALFVSGKSKVGIAKNSILPAFNSIDFFKYDEDKFVYGSLSLPEDRTVPSFSNNINIKYVKQKMNKPQLSYKSAMEWDINELDQKRNFGTLIHLLLSRMKGLDDLERMLDEFTTKHGLSDSEKKEAFEYINSLFKDRHFADYFKGEAWNEKAIVNTNGIKFIPDKIINNNGLIKVIDFKTGQVSPSHQKQVQNYIKVLKDMGYEEVSGEIYYTENLEYTIVN